MCVGWQPGFGVVGERGIGGGGPDRAIRMFVAAQHGVWHWFRSGDTSASQRPSRPTSFQCTAPA